MRWKDRDGLLLSNGAVQAIVLRCGGHVADVRLVSGAGVSDNLLWEAPWTTADAGCEGFDALSARYGGMPAGPFLAGFTGHALCLDTFGPPSQEDAGVPLHGEAAVRTWAMEPSEQGCVAQVELSRSQLRFRRKISLAEGQSALLIEERVENYGAADREVHWVQHVTLGAPLLVPGCSAVQASVDRCRSWPLGYEGRAVLPDNEDFVWPRARTLDGDAMDLRFPFQHAGKGFIAAARVDPRAPIAYGAALNWQLGVALIYCFRRDDFPWVAMWEENGARRDEPWNGTAQVCGMEFGTTPMPLGKEAIRAMGDLFDTPGARRIAAGGACTARYAVCAMETPKVWHGIRDVRLSAHAVVVTGDGPSEPVTVPAAGIQEFLTGA